MALYKRYLVCLMAMFCCATLKATHVFFKHVDATNGLSNNRVNTIYKDTKGYVWLGTASGLNRWDGHDMKIFVSDSRDAKSLPDNYIESIQEARDGILWIKTGAGYSLYDPRTEEFDNDINTVMAKMGMQGEIPQEIRIDHNRNLWINVKGEGVYYYKPSMKLLYEFSYNSQRQELPEGEIVRLVDCLEGMVCCYSNGMMACLDGEHQRIVWQENYVPDHDGTASDRYAAFADRKDNIWLWNSNALYIFKKASNAWLNSLDELARDWGTTVPQMEDAHIRSVVQDSTGRLWLATGNAGILLIDPNEKTMELVTSEENNGRSLRSNNVETLFVDNNNVVWVGTAKHGASYFSDNIFKFDADWLGDITAMVQDGHENLWLGTNGKGVLLKNPATGSTRYFNRQNSGLVSDVVSCLAVSGERVWVGSLRAGLCYIENGKVNSLPAGADGSALASPAIQALAVDAHGNLWIGTQNAGLQTWNAATGMFTTYNVEGGHLPSDNVTDIRKSGNKLLIGTNAGLVVMQIETKRFKTYIGNEKGDATFRSNSVTCTFGDSRGFYWAGTREGLAVYDPKTDHIVLLGAEQDMADESVLAIAEDAQKNMWVVTNSGISKILVENIPQGRFSVSFSIANYNQQDGLQNASFNQNAILLGNDGKMYFGGMAGVNSVATDVQQAAVTDEHLFFTRLFLNGAEVEIRKSYSGTEVLPVALSALDKLSLPYGASVEIRVASDCFARSEKLQYVYRMDGIDNVWLTGGAKGIVYENLPSGRYLLRLKSMSLNSEEKVLIITVAPTFWLTGRAFAIYTAVLLLMVIWVLLMRPRIRAKQNKFQAMQDQLLRLQRLAEEFRAPISTMIPPLNSLVEEEENSKKREYLTTIHYQATQILNLTNKLQAFFEVEKVEDTIKDMKVKKPAETDERGVGRKSVEKDTKPVFRYRLLLVDDNEEYLTFLKDSLPDTFDVFTATTGEKAWDLVDAEHPQLVVCEADMENVTGSDLCVRMKSHREFDRIPFILVTDSSSASEIGDNGINNRVTTAADDYVAKPFNIQVLIAHIYKLLGVNTEDTASNLWDEDDSAIESRAIAATMDEQLRLNAEQFVLQNVSRTSLSVEEMAKSMNMSRAHLYKKLVAITGKTPVEFMRHVRLKQAAMLLRQGSYTVDEVAFNTGFNNVDAFRKFFKDEHECAPEEYHRQIRN